MKTCIDCGKKCYGVRCKDCSKKLIGKSFDFGEWHFDTQTELDNIIKIIIKESPRNIEFENKFLSTLLNKYHSDIVKRNYKVTKFKILDWEGQTGEWEFCRDRFRGGIMVIGFFEPIMQWHGVTLYPHKRKENDIKNKLILSLRQKWSETAKKRDFKDRCENETENDRHFLPQLHHDSISFNKIVEECLKEFTEEELKNGIGEDWWLHESEADALPNNHPAVLKLHELHSFVKYKWLCQNCHIKEKNKEEKNGDTEAIAN